MKKLINIIGVFVAVCMLACNTTASSDGDLDNWWYLTQVDTVSNGKSTGDYRQHRIFWSFQGTLLQLEIPNNGPRYICHFQKSDNRIYQSQLYRYDRMNGDVAMNKDSIRYYNIGEYGITQPVDTFTVETLNSDEMVIKDRTLRLHFERY